MYLQNENQKRQTNVCVQKQPSQAKLRKNSTLNINEYIWFEVFKMYAYVQA